MLEVLYVARAIGYDEAILPAKLIDSLLTVSVYFNILVKMRSLNTILSLL